MESLVVRYDTNQHVSMATSIHVVFDVSSFIIMPLVALIVVEGEGSTSVAESSIDTSLAVKRCCGVFICPCSPSSNDIWGFCMSRNSDAGIPPSRNRLLRAQTEFRIKSIKDCCCWLLLLTLLGCCCCCCCCRTKENPRDTHFINRGNAPIFSNASFAIIESPARLPIAQTHFSHSSNSLLKLTACVVGSCCTKVDRAWECTRT
mmetsp:Transcript_12881/g.27972  ORF Transcript_12881/g.27972 Transcript_12881/m.27972 type:complete len:204 (+) Transcript_12881:288-899(+)